MKLIFFSHNFRFSKERKTFDDSISTCAGVNGKLAEPKNKQINDAYATEANKVFGNGKEYWFGITDRNSEGTWKYVSSGQTVPFTNWQPGQPNQVYDDDCVYLGHSSANHVGNWFDHPPKNQHFFVCELQI